MFCATGTQPCYTKASKGDLLPGQGGFAAKGKPGEALSLIHIYGYLTLIGCYLLMMFYTTVAGWMLHYFYMTATGKLAGLNADQVRCV